MIFSHKKFNTKNLLATFCWLAVCFTAFYFINNWLVNDPSQAIEKAAKQMGMILATVFWLGLCVRMGLERVTTKYEEVEKKFKNLKINRRKHSIKYAASFGLAIGLSSSVSILIIFLKPKGLTEESLALLASFGFVLSCFLLGLRWKFFDREKWMQFFFFGSYFLAIFLNYFFSDIVTGYVLATTGASLQLVLTSKYEAMQKELQPLSVPNTKIIS